ncbi:TetR family transcriptional regulator [Leifsonia naganoensis]|uniref:AcrR family transcriptional regulator n=1 Tax=Leifsonia naganoensis TaxID=150025 RepID=A0A853DM84_9MICO|nr:TetR family transcriptional regulator [Leifsonia naganoensis]NYK09568.1 AcrR family transcriptional regulator [Leifsonia naganoensis]
MGRWEPDAQGRMRLAALELYLDPGFEQTTVADIAERAGVTERTFFRYFTDKREVLFDATGQMEHDVLAVLAATDPSLPALDAAGEALADGTAMLEERREYARRRAAAIAANASLQERELLKLAQLGEAVAAALRARGVAEPEASIAAETAVAAFKVAFAAWIGDDAPGSLAERVRGVMRRLRALAALD